MTVLFGTSNAVTVPLVRHGISVVWTGWDGTEWDLSDYDSQRIGLTSNVTGLLWPEVNSLVTTSPAVDGQRLQGVSVLPRPVVLPLMIRGTDSPDFLDLFTRFTRSWSPMRTGVLSVTSGSTTRRIRLRLNPDGSTGLDQDPLFDRQLVFPLPAIADYPYFSGEQIQGDWSDDGEVRDFFSDSSDYLFWISPSQQFGNATMSNPGDVPAWPVWSITATTASLSGTITVDGGTITFPTIATGKTLVIDTDPATGYADLGAVDGSGAFTAEAEWDGLLNPYDPRPISVGSAVPIGFDLSGPGRVSASITARYWLGIGNV